MKYKTKTNSNHFETGVTFILLRPSGEMLLHQRDEGIGKEIAYPDRWCFPGGKKEHNESYLNTVIREIHEEFNLTVGKDNCTLITRYDHDDIRDDHVYLCIIPQNCQAVLKEGKAMQWKRLKDINKSSLAWKQEKIIFALEKYLSSDRFSRFLNKL